MILRLLLPGIIFQTSPGGSRVGTTANIKAKQCSSHSPGHISLVADAELTDQWEFCRVQTVWAHPSTKYCYALL